MLQASAVKCETNVSAKCICDLIIGSVSYLRVLAFFFVLEALIMLIANNEQLTLVDNP
jgi:hypothetical protein